MSNKNLQTATLGGGCFWCTEAIFKALKGIENVVSGYSGGNVPGHPTYREICSGLTGHAEVVQITFDANIISYEDILLIFMTTHNPTTLNQQGADRGTQYRSVIFYINEKQKEVAEIIVEELAPYYEHPIVTEIAALKIFYKAEDYHQDYYEKNKKEAYCSLVILPKFKKLQQRFKDKLR